VVLFLLEDSNGESEGSEDPAPECNVAFQTDEALWVGGLQM
jgi:hypothetical protein